MIIIIFIISLFCNVQLVNKHLYLIYNKNCLFHRYFVLHTYLVRTTFSILQRHLTAIESMKFQNTRISVKKLNENIGVKKNTGYVSKRMTFQTHILFDRNSLGIYILSRFSAQVSAWVTAYRQLRIPVVCKMRAKPQIIISQQINFIYCSQRRLLLLLPVSADKSASNLRLF